MNGYCVRQPPAEKDALRSFARDAVRRSFHLDLPRQRVATCPLAETHFFEQMKRHGIRARHVKPDTLEYELFATVVEHAQQKPSAETETPVTLVEEDGQLRLCPSLGWTQHGVTDDAVTDHGDELIETLLPQLGQPLPNLGFGARWQPLVFPFRLELHVHRNEPAVVVAHHFSEHGLHGLGVEHCKYHGNDVSGKSSNALSQR